MEKSINERSCEIEHRTLSQYAAFADKSKGRARAEDECPIRTVYQRDRDRVIHSTSFRRLKHKTQVFLSPKGDYYRTRLTHTLEVSQIARVIARGLLLNEDLTEAIALGHDLGHTPFGHAGERALDSVCPDGFKHYLHSLRVVDYLENSGRGLNLTFEVRNGIERHTNGEPAETLEGQIVRLADKIAYINHDIDDAQHAGILTTEDIPADIREILGQTKSNRINTLVCSAVENSKDTIMLSPDIETAFNALHEFMFASVYTNPVCKSEESKAIEMIKRLYGYFSTNCDKLPEEYKKISDEQGAERAACDYIAGMTDRFAVNVFEDIYVPKSWLH